MFAVILVVLVEVHLQTCCEKTTSMPQRRTYALFGISFIVTCIIYSTLNLRNNKMQTIGNLKRFLSFYDVLAPTDNAVNVREVVTASTTTTTITTTTTTTTPPPSTTTTTITTPPSTTTTITTTTTTTTPSTTTTTITTPPSTTTTTTTTPSITTTTSSSTTTTAPNAEVGSVCSFESPWAVSYLKSFPTKSDLSSWTFQQRITCPVLKIDAAKRNRTKVSLDCSAVPRMRLSPAINSSDIYTVQFGDTCLRRVIDSCCSDNKAVPNVVHYVWYNHNEFGFFHFLSYMSAVRFMRPCLLLIHGEYKPYGKYWDYFIGLFPNVIHVNRTLLTHIYGQKLAFKEHGADIMRIEALQVYGGVYLDWDELLLRPLDPLRHYDHTQGLEQNNLMGNQLIMSRRNATFLSLWHEAYKKYSDAWTHNSLQEPLRLSREHPELIHIDGYNFTRPNYGQLDLIFNKNYDWSTNYGMHLFIREYKNATDHEIIRHLNTTIGSVSRHVLFGNKDVCV